MSFVSLFPPTSRRKPSAFLYAKRVNQTHKTHQTHLILRAVRGGRASVSTPPAIPVSVPPDLRRPGGLQRARSREDLWGGSELATCVSRNSLRGAAGSPCSCVGACAPDRRPEMEGFRDTGRGMGGLRCADGA